MAAIVSLQEINDGANVSLFGKTPTGETPKMDQLHYNIIESEELIDFIAEGISKAVAMGKASVLAITVMVAGMISEIYKAFDGIGDVWKELTNLEPQERERLRARFIAKFDLPNEQTEALFEAVFSALLHLFEAYSIVKNPGWFGLPDATDPAPANVPPEVIDSGAATTNEA